MRRLVVPVMLAVVLLAGCDTASPCDVRPTSVDSSGQCWEADGEWCDQDPCDSDDDDDDDDGFDWGKKSKKPSPKSSPAKRRR